MRSHSVQICTDVHYYYYITLYIDCFFICKFKIKHLPIMPILNSKEKLWCTNVVFISNKSMNYEDLCCSPLTIHKCKFMLYNTDSLWMFVESMLIENVSFYNMINTFCLFDVNVYRLNPYNFFFHKYIPGVIFINSEWTGCLRKWEFNKISFPKLHKYFIGRVLKILFLF